MGLDLIRTDACVAESEKTVIMLVLFPNYDSYTLLYIQRIFQQA